MEVYEMSKETIKMNKKQDFFYSYNLIFSMDISAHAKLVYTYLCRCANSEAQSFPARKTIGEACSIGLTSVRNALKELIEAKLLKKQEQFRSNGGQTSNLYTVYSEPYIEEEHDDEEVSENDMGDAEEQVEAIDNLQKTDCSDNSIASPKSPDSNAVHNSCQVYFNRCQSKYAPQPLQNTTTGVAKCAPQKVLPMLRSTHNQVSLNNGEKIRDG
jgi:predicted transcriptional regulator